MRICRYQKDSNDVIRIGIVKDDYIYDVSAIADELPDYRWPLPTEDVFIAHLEEFRPKMEALAEQAEPVAVDSVILKCPVANPGKFMCGAGNHKVVLSMGGHPRKLGLLFKTINAAAGPGDGVTLRWPERVTFHEMELAIIIGKKGFEIPVDKALDYVAGYSIGLDMTMQGDEMKSFGKCFDTYGVIGPWMVTADEIPDPSALDYVLKVNDEERQVDSVANQVLDPASMIEHVSSVMTIFPGDVIFCGTPPTSVGPVVPGDVMHAQMDQIGSMSVRVLGGDGCKLTPLEDL